MLQKILIVLALIVASLTVCHASASALPEGSSPRIKEGPDTLEIGEVNVTSIKQARSLLRQPVTVTTLRRSEIERLAITGMKGVSEVAPNFFMPDYGSKMTSSIYVRGIGARIDHPAVGLNVDNVPCLNKNAYDFDAADIDRIEVLRGPQSTLFGRNTIAGLINIYTLSPFNYQGIRATLEGATHQNYRYSLSAYTKLSPRVAMSLAYSQEYRGGYFRNTFNNSRADRSLGRSARWKTVWRPTDHLSVENTASFGHTRQNGYPYASADGGVIGYNDTCYYKRTTFTDGLTVTWGNDHVTLASITGFQYIDDDMALDQDFTPREYFTLRQRQHDRSITQDFVARGTVGNYSWLAGVFGFLKHSDTSAPVTFKSDGIDELILGGVNGMLPSGMALTCDASVLPLLSSFCQPVKGAAVYHQSSYDFDDLTFALGLRFDYEHTQLDYRSRCDADFTMWSMRNPSSPVALGTSSVRIDDPGSLKQHFTQLLPKVSVTYNLPHSAIFFSLSKGYKAGGYNTQMFSDFLQQRMMEEMGRPVDYDISRMVTYRPEVSWNYEVGGHFSVDRGRVYSSFALFLIECRDQQITMFPDGTTTGRIMANAGRTRSLGGEFTLSYAPVPRWKFSLAYGYTHATFRRFSDGRVDYKGKRVPYAPSNTLFLSAAYSLPLGGDFFNSLTLSADLCGAGSIYWDEANEFRQPFYSELGASANVAFKGGSLELWGRNLADTDFTVFRFESMSRSFFQHGLPARGGLTLRLDLPFFN